MFDIRFTDDPAISWYEERARRGEIRLGGHREGFYSPLVYWSEADYAAQWDQGVQRILDGRERSCLITRCYDPNRAEFLEWWPMYRDGPEGVIITNSLLFLDRLASPLSVHDPYSHLPDFEAENDDGQPISHWRVTLGDLGKYIHQKNTTR